MKSMCVRRVCIDCEVLATSLCIVSKETLRNQRVRLALDSIGDAMLYTTNAPRRGLRYGFDMSNIFSLRLIHGKIIWRHYLCSPSSVAQGRDNVKAHRTYRFVGLFFHGRQCQFRNVTLDDSCESASAFHNHRVYSAECKSAGRQFA